MHAHSAKEHQRSPQPLPMADGELVLASFLVDLDAKLHFCQGEVTLSNRRILSREQASASWLSWPLSPDLHLKHHDHAGVGTLELHNAEKRLACWRFTLDAHSQAMRLVEQFERLQSAQKAAKPKPKTKRAPAPAATPRYHRMPRSARFAIAKRKPRLQPGCCCGFGVLPNPTNGNCWAAFC